jgi:large conductance mechanosensitive channel
MGSAQKIKADAARAAPANPAVKPKEGPVLKDFKEFIARGNVLDLAIGVVIGAAFGKIVDSLVKDIIMPPIGLLISGVKFDDYFISLNGQHYATLEEATKAAAPTIKYGFFINQVITFVIVAFAVFLVIKQVNRFRKPAPAAPAAPTEKECPFCRMNVPSAATRCAHCTSALNEPALAGR